VKIPNGRCIQDVVENVYIFHPIFSKRIICQFYILFWGKIRRFVSIKVLFLSPNKFKNKKNLQLIIFENIG
jgi:hypothetical protein